MSAVDTRFVGRRTAFLFVAGGNVRSRACRVGMMKGCHGVWHILFDEVPRFPGVVLVSGPFD